MPPIRSKRAGADFRSAGHPVLAREEALAGLRGDRGSQRFDSTGGNAPASSSPFPDRATNTSAWGGTWTRSNRPSAMPWIVAAEVVDEEIGRSFLAVLYPSPGDKAAATTLINETWITQPAIFTVSYATAMLLASDGIRPDIVLGHSVGE